MGPKIPTCTLQGSTEKAIPLLGCGTGAAVSKETIRESVREAIEVGYRHFDTASLYQSEGPLGEGIADALRLGLIKSRDELFISSKLWCTEGHKDLVLPAIQKTLKNLQLDYLDLYLIHWPLSLKPGEIQMPVKKEDILPMDIKSVWEAMEECQKLGLVKSIGVSNFSSKKLEILLATAKTPPAVHQVEMSPLWQQKKMRQFCKEKGIHVTAYAPLGSARMQWGTNKVMQSEVLKEIAAAKGKSVAQISLRWIIEQGASVVARSFSKERMKQNMDIFDWKLSEEDLEKISKIPQHKVFVGNEFISENGPFKSLEELWDGEM